MKKLAAMTFALCAFGLQAQNDRNDQMDQNQNFRNWDSDEDGYINDSEFNTTWDKQDYYRQWDSDRDGTLNQEEWQQGTDNYYGRVEGWQDNANRNYSAWDSDGDGVLNENEFRTGNYNTWDADRDGRIGNSEYDNYSSGYSRSADGKSKMKNRK